MYLLKRLLVATCILVCAKGFAAIESTNENIESSPFEELEAFERKRSAQGEPISPIRKKIWGQGGDPGFLSAPSPSTSEIETTGQNIESEPFEELEEYERRELAQEKKGEISITGDVRLRWTPQWKKTRGYPTRGSAAVNPVDVPGAKTPACNLPEGQPIVAPTNYFETEFNLYADYDGGTDWVETQIRFKNIFGIDSGSSTSVTLKKAWVGYAFYENETTEFYTELGRKGMSSIFDSRIQFDNTFDGILVTYSKDSCLGSLKAYGGPFIVDFVTNHYSWVTEIDLLEILGTGFYTKYSFIYWRKRGVDRWGVYDAPNYRFANSQIMLGYDFCPDYVGYNFGFYGAFLVNHAAKVVEESLGKKRNMGWYVAAEWGKVGKKGDWLIDLCYQDVGLQAVSNIDMSGIGRGNSTARGDKSAISEPATPPNYINPQDVLDIEAPYVNGNTNFRGLELRTYYSLSDRITIKATTDYSWEKIRGIGDGNNRFVKFDLQVIYDF